MKPTHRRAARRCPPSRGSSDLVERGTACGRRASTRRKTGYQLEPRNQAPPGNHPRAPPPLPAPACQAEQSRTARATNFFVISFLQRKEKSVLSIGREGPAAAAAASAIESSSRGRDRKSVV